MFCTFLILNQNRRLLLKKKYWEDKVLEMDVKSKRRRLERKRIKRDV